VLSKDWRSDLVENTDELEEGIVRKILQSELTLASVTRIGLSEDSMTESRDDLTTVKSVPETLLHNFNINATSELFLEVLSPLEHFLVGETVKRTSKTVHTSSKREIRIGESTAHQVSGVSRNITTLMITVDDKVKTHELIESLVVETKHSVEVGGPIEVGLTLESSVLVGVAVDASSYLRKTSNEVHGIFIGVLPVLLLVDTSAISSGEFALGLKSQDSNAELGHWMHGSRETGKGVDNVFGELRALRKLLGDSLSLGLGGDLAGHQKPEESLREGFVTANSLGEKVLAFRDGKTTETNSFISIKKRGLSDQGLDATHTSIGLKSSNG
jgi:hypothetical protein